MSREPSTRAYPGGSQIPSQRVQDSEPSEAESAAEHLHVPAADTVIALNTLGQDLRNTLIGTAGVCQIAVGSSAETSIRQRFSEVLQGLNGALELVDDLLSFASAAMEGQGPSLFSGAEIVGECLAQARSQVQRSSVVVRSILGVGSDLLVRGDKSGSELLVATLLRGAIVRASGEEVLIKVAAEELESGRTAVEITIGEASIAQAEDENNILEFCARIAARLGGAVKELSTGGYRISLVFDGVTETERRPGGAGSLSTLHDKRVLVVDDDPALRQVYKTMLQQCGALCDEAEDGQEAISKVQGKRYELVFMDLNMPRMDGLRAIKEIRQLHGVDGWKAPPIIAMTALSSPDVARRSVDYGALACLNKPLQRSAIEAVLRRCFDSPSFPAGTAPGPEPQVSDTAFRAEQVQQTLELMGDDEAALSTLAHLIVSYRQHTPQMVERLTACIEHDDDEAENLAHTLKSRSAALGLIAARDSAAALEQLAHERALTSTVARNLIWRFECNYRAGLDELHIFTANKENHR